MIAVVVIVAIVAFIALTGHSPDDAEPPKERSVQGTPSGTADPFADLAPIEPPRRPSVDKAPPGLDKAPNYVRAIEIANEGIALVNSATEARDIGDNALFRERALAGRDKLFEAKAMTTEWLIDLQDKYPDDRQLRQIEQTRRAWDKALKKVKNL